MFKVAGVSKFKGEFKVRFANDLTRVKLLAKAGNTDINLVELPRAMNKSGAVTYLKTSDLYKVPAQAAAIDAADAKYNGAKNTVKTKKAGKPTIGTKPSIEAIKARAGAKVVAKATEQQVEPNDTVGA